MESKILPYLTSDRFICFILTVKQYQRIGGLCVLRATTKGKKVVNFCEDKSAGCSAHLEMTWPLCYAGTATDICSLHVHPTECLSFRQSCLTCNQPGRLFFQPSKWSTWCPADDDTAVWSLPWRFLRYSSVKLCWHPATQKKIKWTKCNSTDVDDGLVQELQVHRLHYHHSSLITLSLFDFMLKHLAIH